MVGAERLCKGEVRRTLSGGERAGLCEGGAKRSPVDHEGLIPSATQQGMIADLTLLNLSLRAPIASPRRSIDEEEAPIMTSSEAFIFPLQEDIFFHRAIIFL